MPRLKIYSESWPLREAFTISRGSRTETSVIVCELEDNGVKGWGEGQPNARYNETRDSTISEIEKYRANIESGEINRLILQEVMPAGAARNALDCAFWDLEAKLVGKPVWELAGLQMPGPVTTAFTLSAGSPAQMAFTAEQNRHRPLIKMKLIGKDDLDCVHAVRNILPETPIIVDANEGWDLQMLEEFAAKLKSMSVELIEQPLPSSLDQSLANIPHPVPICADESCLTSANLAGLKGRYEVINIKLDKTGGLTEALKLRRAALSAGIQVMVGCMIATSLSMAPGVLVAQGAVIVDLDGPLLLERDREFGLHYDELGRVHPSEPVLWG